MSDDDIVAQLNALRLENEANKRAAAEERQRAAEERQRAAEERQRAAEERQRLVAAVDEERQRADRAERALREARQLPALCKSPSKMSASDLLPLVTLVSVVYRRVYWNLFCAMLGRLDMLVGSSCNGSYSFGDTFCQLIEHARNNRQWGNFDANMTDSATKYCVSHREEKYSCLAQWALQRDVTNLGGVTAAWLHQMPDVTGAKSDVKLNSVSDAGLPRYPISIWEFARNVEPGKKTPQLQAYCVNALYELEMHASQCLLAVEIYVFDEPARESHMAVHCAGFGQFNRIEFASIWRGTLDTSSIDRLLQCAELVAKFNECALTEEAETSLWEPLGVNVGRDVGGGRVLKAFDYRNRVEDVDTAQRRNHALYLNTEILHSGVLLIDVPDCTIVGYAFISSSVFATRVGQFHDICKHLQTLHDSGFVHGDIRNSNLLFADEPGKSCLIDFDFSGKENETFYPIGFNLDIEDGQRCPFTRADGQDGGNVQTRAASKQLQVSSGQPLLKSHDLYSLAWLMTHHYEANVLLSDAAAALGDNRLDAAVRVLALARDVPLVAKVTTKRTASGSPPRVQNY